VALHETLLIGHQRTSQPDGEDVFRMSKQKVESNEETSLRDELLGRFERDKWGLKNREISVMTRLSTDIVDILDALVELEIFKSRSEVVASFVEKAIMDRKDLFDSIAEQASDIEKRREKAKQFAFQAIQSRADSD
jgi:Arc/MetJ-type ribon-helix-helix transcriptional regulator